VCFMSAVDIFLQHKHNDERRGIRQKHKRFQLSATRPCSDAIHTSSTIFTRHRRTFIDVGLTILSGVSQWTNTTVFIIIIDMDGYTSPMVLTGSSLLTYDPVHLTLRSCISWTTLARISDMIIEAFRRFINNNGQPFTIASVTQKRPGLGFNKCAWDPHTH
jgi:hypothetical protein